MLDDSKILHKKFHNILHHLHNFNQVRPKRFSWIFNFQFSLKSLQLYFSKVFLQTKATPIIKVTQNLVI